MITGPIADPQLRREMAERRVRAAVRSARETPYHRRLPDGLGRALAAVAVDDAVVRTEGGTWLSIVDGRVVGAGATPGTARRAARVRDHREAVVVIGSAAKG